MRSTRSSYITSTVLTSLALAITLSSCSAPVSETPKPSETAVTATATATPTSSEAPSTAEPTTATSSPALVNTPTSVPTTEVAVATLKTFTFSDGHISFDYPSNWTLKTEQGPYIDSGNGTAKEDALVVRVYDENGSEVATMSSGGYGGGVSGPVVGHVYDSEPMSSLPSLLKGGKAKYAFFNYHLPNEDKYYYNMGVFDDRYATTDGDSFSPNQFLLLQNGAASAQVTFGTPAFKSPESAKAWMQTQQYSQLKAMMISLSYK